jgi:membrane protease YdiL (CAAX protease family)
MLLQEKLIESLLIPGIVTVLIVWLAASGWAMVRLRVFGAPALANAPMRVHRLSIFTLLGITTLYIALLILTGAVINFEGLQKSGEGMTFVMLFDSIAKGLAALLFLPAIAFSFEGGLDGFGLSLRKLPKGIGLGVLAALIILPWIFLVEEGAGGLSEWIRHAEPPVHPLLKELAKKPEPLAQWILVCTACVFAPILEELYFRGLLQTMVVGRRPQRVAAEEPVVEGAVDAGAEAVPAIYIEPPAVLLNSRRWTAIFLVSFLFVLVHFDTATLNFEVIPPLALLAITLGFLYERTGNLWACITLHSIFNTVSTIAFLKTHR